MDDISTKSQLNTTLPWGNFIDLVGDKNVEQAASIPEETYLFAADPANHDTMVDSALKSLQSTNQDTATREKAEALADMMHIFAKMMIKELELARGK